MSLADRLAAALPALSPNDRTFALSLLASAGRWSSKQEYWAAKLADRATAPQVAPEVIDVSGILALLTRAGAKLKRPKVRLETASGQRVVLSIAGDRSRYTGSVMLTDGRPFGENTYFGRIDPTGALTAAHAMTAEVLDLLRRFATDPAGTGSVIGKAIGSCCFCSRQLETKESLAVGYGPVCAENYGLPWG